ncbi:type I methionyl aminopeptidase [Gammaproteobacteria bacterium]|nr:type I methionyl aminopeptidase [Gammaproteobacteria bacterium]
MNTTKYIKTPQEIEKMRAAGKAAASVLDYLTPFVKAQVTTDELNQIAHTYMTQTLGVVPAPLNYRGFPKSICTSINHVVCHGIPSERTLKDGDIINIDVTVIKDGYHGDTSRMFEIGQCKPYASRLCNIAKECMQKGIEIVRPGTSLYDIGLIIEQHARANHYSSVRDFCGHGIGKDFHEEGFQVLHYPDPNLKSFILEPNMTFTIEPMINQGKKEVRIMGDGWTAITADKTLSAQWEHTILVTDNGYEILTIA